MTPEYEENILDEPIFYSTTLADLAIYINRENDLYVEFFQDQLKKLTQLQLDAFLIHYIKINHTEMIKILLGLGANVNRKPDTFSKCLY